MADAPHQQIDLTVDGTTYKAAFKRHPDVPDYPARLIGPFGTWEESLPLPMDGFLPERSVEVRFQNYGITPTYGLPHVYIPPFAYGRELTLDSIRQNGTLIGQTAMARLRNVSGGSDLRRIDGVVTEEGDTDNTAGTFRIGTVDTALFEQKLPRQKIRDLFAAAVLTRGSIEDADPPVYVCCGVSRKVPLVQLNALGTQWGVVRSPASGTLTWATVYLNKAVLHPDDYSVTTETIDGKSVKYIEIDGFIPNADEQILMHADLTSTEFRNTLEFVKFLLSDPDYGLSPAQSVNAAAFTTESNVLHALSYAATGGLYERFPAQDLFLQLLVRGTYLSRNTSNEWYPVVDQASAHPASSVPFRMGQAAGAQTIIPDSIVSRRGNVHDLTKTLEVGFNFDPGFDGNGKYLGLATKTVTQLGTVRRWDNPFLDRTTAEKECGYALSALRLQDRVLDCDIDLRGQALVLGEVVTVNIPHRSISGSRMIRSLGMSWSGDEASAEISGGYACSTVPYDASIYTATADADDTVLLPEAAEVTDYSHTVPGVGTSFGISGTPEIIEHDGTTVARVTLTVISPGVNRTDVIFAVYPVGGPSSIQRQVIEITGAVAPAAQTAYTASFDLPPGTRVDYQAVIQNTHNVAGRRSSAPMRLDNQLVPGDATPPGQVQSVTATVGTGKSIEVAWAVLADPTLDEYIIYRNTSANPGSDSDPAVHEHARVRANRWTDTDLDYDTTYHYRVKAIDHTGLLSTAFSSPSVNAAVVKVGDSDSAITASALTAGTLTVNTSGVKIDTTGDSALAIVFGASFAKIKWWSTAFTGLEKAHIGAGNAGGFNGIQVVMRDLTGGVRLGTSGEVFTNLGLYFSGVIDASETIFDSTTVVASSGTVYVAAGSGDSPTTAFPIPNRRIKIVTATGDRYIWCSDAPP